jgi:hypothetical protein
LWGYRNTMDTTTAISNKDALILLKDISLSANLFTEVKGQHIIG